MGKGDSGNCVFPLTSLQIGDLQSYLSHLNLFLAPESKKLYILLDNRPWLENLVSRPAHLWQLMVTKSRMSPFANTRGRKQRKESSESVDLKGSNSNGSKSEKLKRWFSLVDAATLSKKRAMLPVKKLQDSLILNSKLHRTLYGFIVFEVAWADVRGISYINELQTDTSLAIEAKYMKRWEFDSIEQSARCISSWFPGTYDELCLLKEYLESAIGEVFYDAQENFPESSNADDDDIFSDVCAEDTSFFNSNFSVYPGTMENVASEPHTPPPPDGPYKRRKVTLSTTNRTFGSPLHSQTSYASDCEELVEATHYRDVLLLFRFNDRDLPFKLKEIIMSELRLLTLLEAGLPSWVIFLQSYPGFCHLYRPWMCPLVRALYVLISIATVLIGFYDLYKNVPVLKATASRLFGPLFDWIETWEMVSRIKYLGTMLFLHNSEKALKWVIMTTRTVRSFLSVLAQPIAGPFLEFVDVLLPFWSMCIQLAESFCSVIWDVIEFSCSLVENLFEVVLFPVWFILSVIWSIATSVLYPVFWILWEVLYAPIRIAGGLCSLVAFICTCIYDLIGDIWLSVSSIFQFASSAEATVKTYEVSIWRSLWNDLFSQVFRAVRSILHGFVAFFTACNRHRLSIYNHLQEFIRRISYPRSRAKDSSQLGQASGSRNMSKGVQQNTPRMKYKRQI
ncbi:hypothetical protein LguiA_022765 [Lonicera macranthoides]